MHSFCHRHVSEDADYHLEIVEEYIEMDVAFPLLHDV